MAQKSRCCTLAQIAVWLLPVVLGNDHLNVIHGDYPCNTTKPVSLQAILTYVRPVTSDNEVCNTNFFASSDDFVLVAKFLMYFTDSFGDNEEGNCSEKSIQLFNSRGLPLLGRNAEYCSSKKPSSLYFIGKSGNLIREVKTKRYPWVNPITVNILITEVYYKNISCPYEDFDCDNNYCVDPRIICNGYDNCGNNRDEGEMCTSGYRVFLYVLLGCIMGVMVVGLVFYLLCEAGIIH